MIVRAMVKVGLVPGLLCILLLPACSGSGGKSGDSVIISGTVTFDWVPHGVGHAGLDYDQTARAPARGVQMELLNHSGEVLDRSATNDTGAYSLKAPTNVDVRVRARAQMQQTGTPSWDFSITDNTSGNALYVLDGELATSGRDDSIRDLHAASGWDGWQYAEPRSAAPFAILDTVYEALQLVLAVEPSTQFPALELRWSPDNIALSGEQNLPEGHIGTSFYTTAEQSIYLLGYADNDTDEYDRSVILHEFAHYLEYQLIRTDTIGGNHSLSTKLDMRVAFSEGWSNAFAGMVDDNPLYKDSAGTRQSRGFMVSVEDNNVGNHGWYSENSVQKILYGLYRDQGVAGENIEGFAPIYRTLISEAYQQFSGATSIYAFISQYKATTNADQQAVDALLQAEDIAGTDAYGSNETNDGGSAFALPVYSPLGVGETIEVCSDYGNGNYNGLDVRRFIRFELGNSADYQVSVARVSGLSPSNPDFVLWHRGNRLEVADSAFADREKATRHLDADSYWLEVYESSNANRNEGSGGLACFNVSLGAAP